MRNPLIPKHHLIQNATIETIVGVGLFILGCVLLYDAWDSRGKKMPWPFGGLAPW